MAIYPEYTTIGYAVPLIIEMEYRTMKSNFDDLGKEKRRRKWLYPKRNITINYKNITYTEARTLWQFYQARFGAYDVFSFYLKDSDVYDGEYIGTGDGSTTIFDLPGVNISSETVYNDGNTTASYSISAGNGTDGADQIIFDSPPTLGNRLTIDFAGRLRVRSRFFEDIFSYEIFYQRLTSIGIKLKGLLNDE